MPEPLATLYFDFVDPLSYLADLELCRLEPELPGRVVRAGFELRPPPAPLTAIDEPLWAPRWEEARALAPQIALHPPHLVPWTRKAHELHFFALERRVGDKVRRAVFEAYLVEGRDIGRVDELVTLGTAVGLDRTETKAVLDVDRFEERVAQARREAEIRGVATVPAIQCGNAPPRGFHNPGDVSTLLGAP